MSLKLLLLNIIHHEGVLYFSYSNHVDPTIINANGIFSSLLINPQLFYEVLGQNYRTRQKLQNNRTICVKIECYKSYRWYTSYHVILCL